MDDTRTNLEPDNWGTLYQKNIQNNVSIINIVGS